MTDTTATGTTGTTPLPPIAPLPPRSPTYTRFHVWLYRATGGRLGGRLPAHRFLMLTTTGRKTGTRYAVPLAYHTDGATPYLIASNYGKQRPPAWYLNLQANPFVEVERNGKRQWMRATIAGPKEHARIWADLVGDAPYYAFFQRHTIREIPIVLLHPST